MGKTKEKLCLYCKQFGFSMGEPAYSEVTPGADASFDCYKGHWEMSNFGSREEFVNHIESAGTCKDFERKDSL